MRIADLTVSSLSSVRGENDDGMSSDGEVGSETGVEANWLKEVMLGALECGRDPRLPLGGEALRDGKDIIKALSRSSRLISDAGCADRSSSCS